MERLTKRYVDGQAWVSMNHVAASGEYECVGPAIDRLAAYEDTGLTPEKVAELAQAERGGRLLALPCKDGKVYTIEEDYFQCDSCEHKAKSYYHQDVQKVMCDREDVHCPLFVKEHVTEGFEVSCEDGKTVLSAPGEWGYEGLETFSGCDGKWYLTREEAEAALELLGD